MALVLGPQAQEKFTSPDRIGDMLYGSVSANEVQERVNMAAYASSTAPADVRAALTSRYGLTQADLTSYWLEPDETTTMLQTRMGAARIVGAATLNDMNATTAFAEELAREGVDYAQGFLIGKPVPMDVFIEEFLLVPAPVPAVAVD